MMTVGCCDCDCKHLVLLPNPCVDKPAATVGGLFKVDHYTAGGVDKQAAGSVVEIQAGDSVTVAGVASWVQYGDPVTTAYPDIRCDGSPIAPAAPGILGYDATFIFSSSTGGVVGQLSIEYDISIGGIRKAGALSFYVQATGAYQFSVHFEGIPPGVTLGTGSADFHFGDTIFREHCDYRFCAQLCGGQVQGTFLPMYRGGYMGDCSELGGDPYGGDPYAGRQAMTAMAPAAFAAPAPSPTLRVGLITPWLCAGGAEDWQLTLVDATRAALGDLVEWVGAACIHEERAEPAMVAALESRLPLAWGWEAGRDLAARCDVLVSWHAADHREWFAGLASPPKVLWANHTPNEWRADAGPLLATCDRFAAVSDSALAALPPALRGRAAVIPNAIDPARLEPTRSRGEVRASWGVGPDDFVVLQLGRLDREKNPRAALELARSAPGLRVVLVGGGTMRAELEAAAPPNCRVAGPDLDKGSVLRAADVLLVPSLYESFGLALAEAWTVGLPVVAAPVGLAAIHPDLVRPIPHGAAGLAIAAAIEADRRDPAGTARRVEASRAFALASFGPGPFGRAYAAELAGLAPAPVGAAIRRELGIAPEATCRACDRLDPLLYCRACNCLGTPWHKGACPIGKW